MGVQSSRNIHNEKANMKQVIQSVKGARDFYPEDKARENWLYEKIRTVSMRFGYEEYDGPFLERLDLYAAKLGEELVKEQAFVFPDRGGELIALRPELTLSLARMVAQRQGQLVPPLRWWSFGPFWRYEKPQKGRAREFFQWNADLIGVSSPEADAELIAIVAEFLRSVELTFSEVVIRVNDRQLMEMQLKALGVEGDKKGEVFKLIDRREKMKAEDWESNALELGLKVKQLEGLKALLADKEGWRKSENMTRVFEALDALGVREYVVFDPHIVRGIDYYTGLVFECFDVGKKFRAILGGGHYDNLVADVGGEPLPGVGFAMGDMVIMVVLEDCGKLPVIESVQADVLVTLFDQANSAVSMQLATRMRAHGLRVAVYPEFDKLGKQFKYADRLGARFVTVIGPDEAAAGKVTLKDLAAGSQLTIPLGSVTGQILHQLVDEKPS
jgi:histidyl-tRNA synthetase